MDEKKKNLIKNILLYGGLVLVIAITIITSIVLNYKQNQLNDLKDKNEQIEESIGEDKIMVKTEDFENFSKNLYNFIDNPKNI